ncbi:MAG: hypothetical protein LBP70_00725 [Mycoplasmataceae bacterium]|nr:hypothetical protein [Mycoplasmataceae bacterium]
MKWENETDFYKLLYFIGKWELVNIKMLKLEFPVVGRNWTRYMSTLTKMGYVRMTKYKFHIGNAKKLIPVNIYKLTNVGIQEYHCHWESIPWVKSNISPVVLEHNFICLRVIKEYLKLNNPYRYYLGLEMEYYRSSLKNKGIETSLDLKYASFNKSVDFIYLKNVDGTDIKIAAEIELTQKTKHRYWGSKIKKTVFSKLNRDYQLGLFNSLEYYVPRNLYKFLKAIFDTAPDKYKLKMPWRILILDEILLNYNNSQRYINVYKNI